MSTGEEATTPRLLLARPKPLMAPAGVAKGWRISADGGAPVTVTSKPRVAAPVVGHDVPPPSVARTMNAGLVKAAVSV